MYASDTDLIYGVRVKHYISANYRWRTLYYVRQRYIIYLWLTAHTTPTLVGSTGWPEPSRSHGVEYRVYASGTGNAASVQFFLSTNGSITAYEFSGSPVIAMGL